MVPLNSTPDSSSRRAASTSSTSRTASEVFVGASAIQLHAGVGYTWEHDIHLFDKRLLTLQHLGGSSADHVEEPASIVLD